MKNYLKFAWFLIWFTPYAVVSGIAWTAYMWYDDVVFEYHRLGCDYES